MNGSAQYIDTTETAQRYTISHSRLALKAHKGKSPQWAELWAVYLATYFVWKEKQPKIMIIHIWAVENSLAS